jgi:hypothetical protein
MSVIDLAPSGQCSFIGQGDTMEGEDNDEWHGTEGIYTPSDRCGSV